MQASSSNRRGAGSHTYPGASFKRMTFFWMMAVIRFIPIFFAKIRSRTIEMKNKKVLEVYQWITMNGE
jgi:hypothetical protein